MYIRKQVLSTIKTGLMIWYLYGFYILGLFMLMLLFVISIVMSGVIVRRDVIYIYFESIIC